MQIKLHRGTTAFVGQNNTGKSTILKLLWEIRPLFEAFLRDYSLQKFLRGSDSFLEVTWPETNQPPKEMFNDNDEKQLPVEIEIAVVPEGHIDDLDDEVSRVRFIIRRDNQVQCMMFGQIQSQSFTFSKKHVVDRENGIISEEGHNGNPLGISAICTALRILFQASYFPAFRFAEGATTDGQYYDSSVGTSFIRQWKRLKNGPSKEDNRKASAVTKKISEIFDFDDFDLVAGTDDEHLRVSINDSPARLDEVGAGITQAIMLLTYCMVEEPSFVLVDEPELNLHHNAQMKLLQALLGYTRYGIIFSTHNLGLARRCADRINCVTRQSPTTAPFIHPYENHPYLAEIYQALTYSGYFDYDAKKVLLVEGPTDVKVFKRFLKLYDKDHEFIILNLGGGSMINGKRTFELEELQRLAEEIVVIIDSERTSSNMKLGRDRHDFINIVKRLGFRCCVLERRATENYLSQTAVNAVMAGDRKALGEFDKLDNGTHWPKEKNHKIAQSMSRSELEDTDLGRFIASL